MLKKLHSSVAIAAYDVSIIFVNYVNGTISMVVPNPSGTLMQLKHYLNSYFPLATINSNDTSTVPRAFQILISFASLNAFPVLTPFAGPAFASTFSLSFSLFMNLSMFSFQIISFLHTYKVQQNRLLLLLIIIDLLLIHKSYQH